MAVASWLAEADAINFPARAPGVPAWPDSLHLSVQIRANPCHPWLQVKIAEILKAEAHLYLPRLFQRRGRHPPSRTCSYRDA